MANFFNKKLVRINRKRQLKRKMNMNEHITNKDMYIANEHIKLHSVSLMIKKL